MKKIRFILVLIIVIILSGCLKLENEGLNQQNSITADDEIAVSNSESMIDYKNLYEIVLNVDSLIEQAVKLDISFEQFEDQLSLYTRDHSLEVFKENLSYGPIKHWWMPSYGISIESNSMQLYNTQI